MKLDIGVTGGQPNLPGSLTAAARPLPENANWEAFGVDFTPENCGTAWPWQACTTVGVIPAVPCIDEVQQIEISGATGGTFTLTIGGQTTSSLAYGASDATVQAAIDALFDPGDVVVGGSNDPDVYSLTYGGNFACTDMPLAVIDDTQLTGPGAVSAQVTVIIEGQASSPEVVIDKPENAGVDSVEFHPFLAEYNARSCGGIAGDWAALADRAKRGLAVRTGRVIAEVLSSSAPDGNANESPSLPTVATDVTPTLLDGGPAGLVNTVAGLLQEALACGANGELFIHAPHWTLPFWLNDTLITQVGNVFKLGPHTVVLDQGYTNESPVGSPDAAVGEANIYVTGPIEYTTGTAQLLDDTTRGVSTRLNQANAIVAQLAIYRFDPCCVFAARAKVC